MIHPLRLPAAGLALFLLAAEPASAQPDVRTSSSIGPLVVQTVASGLEHPWGLAFLPDGRLLVTERAGRLRIVSPGGALSNPVAGVPDVAARGQGGLLDVALAPDFEATGLIYLSYAEPREGGAGTSVARGRLVESDGMARLERLEVIFRQQPAANGGTHFGSRLAFGRDGTLFVTLGDRGSLRPQVQQLSTHIGKVVRINGDGSVPADNPFRDRDGARPEIWSLGHRNIQGAAIDPETGRLWTVEHGARGGDELNRPEAGSNYGWPIVSHGREYGGGRIGEGTSKPGLEPPVHFWDPSISPSGLAIYDGELLSRWNGDLFTGGLSGLRLTRLKLDAARTRVIEQEALLEGLKARIRDVRQGSDGALWLLTDESRNGRVLRLGPAD